MVTVRGFRAVRPAAALAARVAALPYDVMTSDEARGMAAGEPYSFLRVDRAEIGFPAGTDQYGEQVYARAREVFEGWVSDGVFVQDEAPRFYVYRLTMSGRAQAGLVCCASVDDYERGAIKKHELTRAEKEEDRVRHVDALDANTGPIFLACKRGVGLAEALSEAVSGGGGLALYDFVADDGVRHEVWALDGGLEARVHGIFEGMDALYIADGHHRCASAARVGRMRREQNPGFTGEEEFNFFLSVVFPAEQLGILDYNRVVRDLNGMDEAGFLARLRERFEVREVSGAEAARPSGRHSFGMFLGGRWHSLCLLPGAVDEGDAVARLDVSVLQDLALAPLLGIGDPRTDGRIDFIGGIRGLSEIERRCGEGGDMAVGFAMFPTSMDELFGVADAGLIMPPKSTWFEPKLRSGLFVHLLGE